MAKTWKIYKGGTLLTSYEGSEFEYKFPENTGTTNIEYEVTVINDDGCSASTKVTVPTGNCSDVEVEWCTTGFNYEFDRCGMMTEFEFKIQDYYSKSYYLDALTNKELKITRGNEIALTCMTEELYRKMELVGNTYKLKEGEVIDFVNCEEYQGGVGNQDEVNLIVSMDNYGCDEDSITIPPAIQNYNSFSMWLDTQGLYRENEKWCIAITDVPYFAGYTADTSGYDRPTYNFTNDKLTGTIYFPNQGPIPNKWYNCRFPVTGSNIDEKMASILTYKRHNYYDDEFYNTVYIYLCRVFDNGEIQPEFTFNHQINGLCADARYDTPMPLEIYFDDNGNLNTSATCTICTMDNLNHWRWESEYNNTCFMTWLQ